MTTLYTAHGTAVNGRDGRIFTDDKKLEAKLGRPADGGEGTNPEQLFACGYAACFGGAVGHLAKLDGLDTGEVTVQADVTLNKADDGFFIGATLNVTLPNLDGDDAVALVKKAHDFCPYSKATRGNIDVSLTVNGNAI